MAPVAPLAAAAMTRFTTWKKKKKELLLLLPYTPSAECLDGKKDGRASAAARPQANGSTDTRQAGRFSARYRYVMTTELGYRPFRLAAAPRAIPKKEKEKKRLGLFCFTVCDAIIHLTVSCSHFSLLVLFFLFKDSSSADVAGWPSYISSNPHHVNHDLIGFFQVRRQPVGFFFLFD